MLASDVLAHESIDRLSPTRRPKEADDSLTQQWCQSLVHIQVSNEIAFPSDLVLEVVLR